MCTAVNINKERHLFGRTLDIEKSFGESVVVVPRNYKFIFRHEEDIENHFSIMGIAKVVDQRPLFYDAVNEAGLCMAGLNFVGNAVYDVNKGAKYNIATFELIPFILTKCKSVSEARKLISKTNINGEGFDERYGASELHFIIADNNECIVVESTSCGICVYDNKLGVMTNNPPFWYHETNIANYMHLTNEFVENRLSKNSEITAYSRGMGAIGLPGDYSSASRFVRAFFNKEHTEIESDEVMGVNSFFHVMGSVNVPLGTVKTEAGEYMHTVYTSCIDADNLTYSYKTYSSGNIRCVRMNNCNLDNKNLYVYPIDFSGDVQVLN